MTKSGKHCDKGRNFTFCAISSFVTMFFKKPSAAEASESVYMRERVNFTKSAAHYILHGTIFTIERALALVTKQREKTLPPKPMKHYQSNFKEMILWWSSLKLLKKKMYYFKCPLLISRLICSSFPLLIESSPPPL